MVRALYSLLMWLAQPLLRRKLARRAQAEPGYAVAVDERFGHYGGAAPAAASPLWIHAVSLGETRAAAILLARLRALQPGLTVLLTHGTATGRAEGEKLLRPGDQQVWLPWDTPGAVNRFLDRFRPRAGVLMETEIWPNLVHACRERGIPLVLANARLNEQSLAGARRLGWLARPAYAQLSAVWPQTVADAQRLRQLAAPVQEVFGNLKFDAEPDPERLARGQAWRALRRAADRPPVVMLASSREGEERLFMEHFRRIVPVHRTSDAMNYVADESPCAQLLIVPRHPQRFDEVDRLVRDQGLTVSRRSQWSGAPVEADVWLGDSMGDMALYYGLADMALLGGSFEPLGGQNLIEAAACGCPVIMGPHTFNFAEAAELAETAGAARRVPDMAAAALAAGEWLAQPAARESAVVAAGRFAAAHRGAADRTARAVLALTPAGTTSPAARSPAAGPRP